MKHTVLKRALPGLMAAAIALALSGCAPIEQSIGDGKTTIRVVASTNTWGNLVELVGGKYVSVKALINDPMQDPHSYQASVRDELAVKQANLLIANGENYDVFMDVLAKSVGKPVEHMVDHVSRTIAASGATGNATGQQISGENPHVWYSTTFAIDATNWLGKKLGQIDPAHASTFKANTAKLLAKLERLKARETAFAQGQKATAIEVESLADLKLFDLGIRNVTPMLFWNAVIHENEISPKALSDAKSLIRNHQANLLILNAQEDSVEGKALAKEAKAAYPAAKLAGLPNTQIVWMSELLPANQNYLTWMSANLDKFEKALAASNATATGSNKVTGTGN